MPSGFPISANVKTQGAPFRISLVMIGEEGFVADTGKIPFRPGEEYDVIFNLSAIGTQIRDRVKVVRMHKNSESELAECHFLNPSSEDIRAINAFNKLFNASDDVEVDE